MVSDCVPGNGKEEAEKVHLTRFIADLPLRLVRAA